MSDKVRAWVWVLDLPPARKLVLLWLAGRATDNGVAFPGEREIRDKTGLGERMVRYHLQALTAEEWDGPDTNRSPLLLRIERPIRAGRNTSNVYILRVPWAESTAVRRDLEELKHISEAALNEALATVGVGATGCLISILWIGLIRESGEWLPVGSRAALAQRACVRLC